MPLSCFRKSPSAKPTQQQAICHPALKQIKRQARRTTETKKNASPRTQSEKADLAACRRGLPFPIVLYCVFLDYLVTMLEIPARQ